MKRKGKDLEYETNTLIIFGNWLVFGTCFHIKFKSATRLLFRFYELIFDQVVDYVSKFCNPGFDKYQWRIQGVAAGARPQGSRFFRFDKLFQNIATSGVGAPPTKSAPPTGNPGSATEYGQEFEYFNLSLLRLESTWIQS